MKITERGWGGHFCAASYCNFRRNTLVEHNGKSIVVSTVGNMHVKNNMGKEIVERIGCNRYYETMVFEAIDDEYKDGDVEKGIKFESKWSIDDPQDEIGANNMHEEVVLEIKSKLENGEI